MDSMQQNGKPVPESSRRRRRLPNSSRHKCAFCGKTFSKIDHFNVHMRIHTKEKPFKCHQCDKSYSTNPRLNDHINAIHTKKISYRCEFPDCGKAFYRKSSLTIHAPRHDPDSDSLLPCPICKKMHKKINLRGHIYNHKQEAKHKCDECGKLFKFTASLRIHKNIHLPASERPMLPCNLCNKTLVSKVHLKMHVDRQHSSNLNVYSCTFCDKTFKNQNNLQTHLRTHTGEKPFACSQCSEGFISLAILKHHVKVTHTLEKHHTCKYCPSAFAVKGNLVRHLRVHEGHVKMHKCDICGKVYTSRASLNVHNRTHTGEKNYKCDQCNKCFTTGTDLKGHKLTHSDTRSYACTKCNKTYNSNAGLWSHMFSHLDKKFPCKTCSEEFGAPHDLRRHVRVRHTIQEFKFKCNFCGKHFLTNSSLKTHLARHVGEKSFSCTECPMKFIDKPGLDHHLNSLHRNRRKYNGIRYGTEEDYFPCKYCHKTFNSILAWGLHVPTHPEFHEGREKGECDHSNFRCDSCKKSFNANKYLALHLATHRTEVEVKCRPCVVLLQRLK